MFRSPFSIAVLACAAVALIAVFAACSRGNRPSAPDTKSIDVVVDARVELIGIMRTLTREPEALGSLDFAYARRVHEQFSAHANHPSLKRFAAADRKLGGGDVPVWTALHFASTPGLEPVAPLPKMLEQISPDPAPFDEIIGAMREFSAATDFHSGRVKMADVHADLVSPVTAALRQTRIVEPFEAYLGGSLPTYRVLLAPLLRDANYGLRVVNKDGSAAPCVVVVRRSVRGGQAQFGGAADLRRLLWHEFGHSIVNPAMEAYMARIAEMVPVILPAGTKLPPSISPAFLAYSRLNEYVIRAVVVRLVTLEAGEKAGQLELEQQIKRGYTLLPELCGELEKYEANRDKYPALSDFLPEVLRFFERRK